MRKKVVIYGAGTALTNLMSHDIIDDIMIVGLVDGSSSKWGKIMYGYYIKSPVEITNLTYDEIWIASMFSREIRATLLVIGVSDDKIKVLPKSGLCI